MFLDPTNIDRIQTSLLEDCYAILPELILVGGILFLLLIRLISAFDGWHLRMEALLFVLAALVAGVVQWSTSPPPAWTTTAPYNAFPRDLFGGHDSGLLRYDNFTLFVRLFLYGFTAFTIWLSILTGIPDREDSADFYTLLLGATLGMQLMAMANHLLMIFIAVEMASLPSFALAGFLKGKRQSSEAALKYVVYGGGAAAIMLYGISLIAGRFGTGYLPDIARLLPLVAAESLDGLLLLGLLFIFIGLAFKLSVVPFHFWCPDVFEGASAEVAAFLSVASKGAALALTGRLVLMLAGPLPTFGATPTLAAYLIPTLAFFAALTATFGNLAAYPQTNLKRLLAYSTIAHAGYMLMGLATLRPEGISAVLFYLVTYFLMNLGAFAVVAFLRNLTGSEDLNDFRGLIYRAPLLVITLAFFLMSLLGIPPLVGFMAKFQIFQALFNAAQGHGQMAAQLVADSLTAQATTEQQLSYVLYALLAIGGLNTVISLVYYVKVLKVMILEQPLEEIEQREPRPLPVSFGTAVFTSLLAASLLVVGIFWNPLVKQSDRGVQHFRGLPGVAGSSGVPSAAAGQPSGEVGSE